jgi:transcriptional regulator with XRE-family HTH domain
MGDRPAWLREERRKRNMTKQNLADVAKVSLRTVERAEQGLKMSDRVWQTFEMHLGTFSVARRSERRVDRYRQFRQLARVKSAREFFELLAQASVARLDCDVEPTADVFPVLKGVISFLEARLPNPWDLARQKYRPPTLLQRVEDEASLNELLGELHSIGAGIYCELQWGFVIYPKEGFDGEPYVATGQDPEGQFLLHAVISASDKERESFPEVQDWGLETVEDPLGDEVPF